VLGRSWHNAQIVRMGHEAAGPNGTSFGMWLGRERGHHARDAKLCLPVRYVKTPTRRCRASRPSPWWTRRAGILSCGHVASCKVAGMDVKLSNADRW